MQIEGNQELQQFLDMIFRTVKKYFSLRTYKKFRIEFCNVFLDHFSGHSWSLKLVTNNGYHGNQYFATKEDLKLLYSANDIFVAEIFAPVLRFKEVFPELYILYAEN